MIKCSSAIENWYMFDNKREGYNVDNDTLEANETHVETTTDYIDFLSNGFKTRTAAGDTNANGVSFVYMAFAEAPFVNSNGVPCNAR